MLLGVPVGSDSYIAETLLTFFGTLTRALGKLMELHCPHTASLIARACLGAAKVTYLLRSLPLAHGKALAVRASELLRDVWGSIIGAPVSDAQWELACFPIRMGGLGVTDPVLVQPFAALSSFMSALAGASDTGISLYCVSGDLFREASVIMASSPGPGGPLLGQLSSSGTDVMPILRSSFLKDWASQAAWTSEAYTGLVRTWDAHASDRLARLRQVFCGPHTGVWLTAVPRVTHGRSFFAAAEFQALLKWRLSLPLGGVGQCAGCASPCDLLGDHALCCSSLGCTGATIAFVTSWLTFFPSVV